MQQAKHHTSNVSSDMFVGKLGVRVGPHLQETIELRVTCRDDARSVAQQFSARHELDEADAATLEAEVLALTLELCRVELDAQKHKIDVEKRKQVKLKKRIRNEELEHSKQKSPQPHKEEASPRVEEASSLAIRNSKPRPQMDQTVYEEHEKQEKDEPTSNTNQNEEKSRSCNQREKQSTNNNQSEGQYMSTNQAEELESELADRRRVDYNSMSRSDRSLAQVRSALRDRGFSYYNRPDAQLGHIPAGSFNVWPVATIELAVSDVEQNVVAADEDRIPAKPRRKPPPPPSHKTEIIFSPSTPSLKLSITDQAISPNGGHGKDVSRAHASKYELGNVNESSILDFVVKQLRVCSRGEGRATGSSRRRTTSFDSPTQSQRTRALATQTRYAEALRSSHHREAANNVDANEDRLEAKQSLESALTCGKLCSISHAAAISDQLEKYFFAKAGKLATPALHALYKRAVELTCSTIWCVQGNGRATESLRSELGLAV